MAPVFAHPSDDLIEFGMEQRLAAALRDDGGPEFAELIDPPEHLGKRHGLGDVVVLVAVRAR
jgi:hypothetical protein